MALAAIPAVEQIGEAVVGDARVQNIGGGATEVMLEEVAKRM